MATDVAAEADDTSAWTTAEIAADAVVVRVVESDTGIGEIK
jgi:hypothetical protein